MRAQNALVVVQVGLAVVLLIASGLMLRTFLSLRAVRPGFTHPEHIQTVRIFIPEVQIPAPERVAQMQAEILQGLAAIPGVTAAAFASGLPLEPDYHNGNPVFVEAKTPLAQIPPNRTLKQISPGYFAALGTRFIAGRDFTWDDLFGQRRVAILSENMAREYWGEARYALGKRIRVGTEGPWTEIVGVAENIHEDGVDRLPPAMVYFHAGLQAPVQSGASPGVHRGVTFAIRSNRAATPGFLSQIAAVVHVVNPSLPLSEVRTLEDLYRISIARRSFALILLSITGVMALTLAVIGVYGVLAYAVAQRKREMGIRVAVGAEPGAVKALFVRQGLMLACLGVLIGLGFSGALSRWISSLLFGVTPLDPITYGLSGAVILAAAVTASYIPARRAAAADPMEALRGD
ncbi:MAG: ABC transporter permease [Acidobacteriota bacterium]|nr:ABC transporter permease [Acidobacteriota bacterium]